MAIDPVIAEVRQAREALAQRFNYDLREMIRDARERQTESGRRVVSLPPKPAKNVVGNQNPHPAVAITESRIEKVTG